MKSFFLIIAFTFLLSSCDKDKVNNNNPFLANLNFSVQVNTNLPLYSNLQFPGNSVKVDEFGVGNRGIIVFNAGGNFLAFDGACPNQDLATCSTLTINGSVATCPCDDAAYNLFTGQAPGKQYPLKQYRAEKNGSLIIVSN